MDTPTNDQLPAATPVFSPRQLAARHDSAVRRAAAMVSDSDTILGFTVSALTPATYSRLLVVGSPFLYRQSGTDRDVRDYLWIHWPEFSLDPRAKEKFARALQRRIAPAWLRWRHSRASWHDRTAALYALASLRIADLCAIAFADEGPARGGKHVSATLEAQYIDVFAERYRWEPERTRHTPIRQLNQLLNCINGSDFDCSEAAVIAEELRAANEAAALNSQPSALN